MLIQVISKFSPTVHCRITFLFVLERIGKAAVTKSCKYTKAQHKRFFFFFFYITILRGCWGQQGRVLFHPDILHLKVLPSPEPGHHLPAGRVSESICWQIFQARPEYVHVFFCSLSCVPVPTWPLLSCPQLWANEFCSPTASVNSPYIYNYCCYYYI